VRLTQTLHAWRPCQHTATAKKCRRPLPIPWGSMTGWQLGAFGRGIEDVGAEGSEKQASPSTAGLKALPRIGLCEVGIVGRLPAPGRLMRCLPGLRAKCGRPNLTCRRARARPKAPEAAHLPPCKGRARGREPSLVASFAVWCRPRALATRSAAQICFPDLVGAATPLPGLGDDRQAAPRRAISRPNRSLPRGGQVMAFTDLLESAWKPDHERTVPPPLF